MGGMVYQSYYGNTYSRSLPILFHYADTQRQQECQAVFFDLQRIWLPIYNALSHSISKQQRKNKNPFNILSQYIYQIFHPYKPQRNEKVPSNFGLDRLNRVRPTLFEPEISIKPDEIMVHFNMGRPYVGVVVTLKTTHILLFNLTRDLMLYTSVDFRAGIQDVVMANVQQWDSKDKIYWYMALSGDTWLGNFNMVEF